MPDSATLAEQTVAGRAERDPDWTGEPVKVTMSLPEGCVQNIKWLAERLQVPKQPCRATSCRLQTSDPEGD